MVKVAPTISIITLNWNTTAITCDFLRSIRAQNRYEPVEVIVVDNASMEDPTMAFKEAYPGVQVKKYKIG